MEYNEFRTKTKNIISAGNFLESLQRGEDSNLFHCFLVKNYDLANDRKGDIMCLAIELQYYIAALRLEEYNTMSDEEEIKESLRISIENYDIEEELERLKSQSDRSPIYDKMISDREQNIRALNALKEKYLGREMSR